MAVTTTVKKPAVQNAATNTTGTNPEMGYGGATYGTDKSTNDAITANEQKLKNDPQFVQDEINRSLGVVDARTAAGEDTSAQMDYLKKLGYDPNEVTVQGSPSAPGSTAYIENLRKIATQDAQQSAYDHRNQADAINLQNANSLQEIMANRGLGSSGENITASLNQNAQRSNSLNSINNQLSSDLRNIDTEYNDRMMQDLYHQQDNAYRDKTFDADQAQRAFDNIFRQGESDRDQYNTDRTYDYGVGRDNINDDRYVDERDYSRGRDTIGDNRYAEETKYNHSQDAIDNRIAQQNANRLSSGGGSSSSDGGSSGKPANLNTIIDNVNNLYTAYDNDSGQRRITNPEQLRNYIVLQDLPDDQIDQLLAYYGLLDQPGSSNGGGRVSGPVEMR